MSKENIRFLKTYGQLNNRDDVTDFVEAAQEAIALQDEKCIPILLSYLDDESDYFDVMQFITTELEDFSPQVYIPILLKNIPNLLHKAPQLLMTIVIRMFNSKECTEVWKNNIKMYNSKELKELLSKIIRESDKYKNTCEQFLKILR